jgi:hypothetical protein
VLERNPNYRGETYPCEGEAGDREAGLLADCGKTLPFIDKVVFTREKEQIPYWNKFLQGYYDASGISSDSFDQAVQVASGGEITLTEGMRAQGISLTTSVATARPRASCARRSRSPSTRRSSSPSSRTGAASRRRARFRRASSATSRAAPASIPRCTTG